MTSLKLAIPSKGRLKDQTEAYLADCGLRVETGGGTRGYTGSIASISGLEVWFMSASEIVRALISGDVHLGVTGEDLVREATITSGDTLHLCVPLGFGSARLVVAVPRFWLDVESMSDLDDVGAVHAARDGRPLRVATKYMNLAREYFIAAGVRHFRLVESTGATEGAPANGVADLIVDITTTGQTLAGNGLKILKDGEILKSEAHLVMSKRSNWSGHSVETLRTLLDVIAARRRGREMRILTFDRARPLPEWLQGIDDLLAEPGIVRCPNSVASDLSRRLSRDLQSPVTITTADFVFLPENSIFDQAMSAMNAVPSS